MKQETSCGDLIEVLPIGTRVRSKKFPEALGEIVAHEYHRESGKISPLPYKVYWDNDDLVYRKLGWLAVYPPIDSIEVIKEVEVK